MQTTITIDQDTFKVNIPTNFSFDKTQKTIFVIHGFRSNPGTFGSLYEDLKSLDNKANIIAVDWSSISDKNLLEYSSVKGQIDYVALALSNTFQTLNIDPTKTEIIGHSLGAHLAGLIGQDLKKKDPTKLISQIVGLDPAGPQFEAAGEDARISPDDARRVVVIHTSNSLNNGGFSGLFSDGLGLFRDDLGNLDIYVKKDDNLYGINGINQHDLAVKVYQSLVKGWMYGGINQYQSGSDLNYSDPFNLQKLNNPNLTGEYTINLNYLLGTDGNDTFDLKILDNLEIKKTIVVDGKNGDDLLKVSYDSKEGINGIHLGFGGANTIFNRGFGLSEFLYELVNFSNIERFEITGTQYADVFEGRGGNDIFKGGAGSDELKGGAGNDILNPGYSPYSTDTVDGGEGDDLLQVDYSSKSNGVGIHLGYNGANVIYHRAGTVGDNFELVKFSTIERFDITGTKYADAFEGRTGNDIFSGGDGNDILNGGGGNDILIGDTAATPPAFGAAFTAATNYSPTQGWNSFDQYPRQVADVNGDGRADIVGFGAYGVSVALGQTDGKFVSSNILFNDYTTGWSNFNIMPRQVADVNGDGRADIVGFGSNAVYVALGQDNGTFSAAFTAFDNYSPAQGWNSFDQYPRQLADVKGDGRADIVGFGAYGVSVALGQTDGKFVSSNILFNDYTTGWSNFNIMPRQVADVNGDGHADIVGFGSNAVYVALANNSNDILNGGAGNDTLTGGTGKDTLTGGTESDRFDYRNLTDSLLKSFDVITDFNATAGNDLFLVSTARSGFSNAGSVATLSATGIAAKLTNFASNSAAQFTFSGRTFVAINDATAGFNANSDSIIEVTGLTGTLTASNFIADGGGVVGIASVPGGGIGTSSGGFTRGDSTPVPITDNPSIQPNEITGTPGRDTLIGTSTSDRITGLQGADIVTGGGGNDEFVYTNIRDNGDTITDFEVGNDHIVLTQLLDSLVTGGYNGANAIADGYVKVVQGTSTSNFSVQIDADGSTGHDIFRPFITVNLAGTGTLNNPSSFVF
ncbi:bluetail domain-containing putative surface protein [Nostoc sp. 'Peltigera membranacea cyanobiont' 213]|uniref:bluetail domain-containing putative surface protein n=1 Tax=Nostoc sp. 'Peltigera membranacea cyanobiont' 213 TaxID=2014530 RepID=UPI00167D3045|nr:bluetail domain-containing putative surface protein [Nostoc sp. 'Peltigera membranacea cyanobiont' 213]